MICRYVYLYIYIYAIIIQYIYIICIFIIFASQKLNIICFVLQPFDGADPLLYWERHHGWLIQGESSAPWSSRSKDRGIQIQQDSTRKNGPSFELIYLQVPSFLTAGRTLPKWMKRAVGFCKKKTKMGLVCGPVWHVQVERRCLKTLREHGNTIHQENANPNVQLSNIQQVQHFISLDSTRPIQAFKFSFSPMCTSPLRELAPNPS